MPHIIIDFSANLKPEADIQGLCDSLRRTAAAQEIFPADGVRVRAHASDCHSMADGDPEHGFVDITVRLREGRALADKRAATAALFEAAQTHLAPVLARRPLMLSLEMRDIDAELAPKLNTVRAYLQSKKDGTL